MNICTHGIISSSMVASAIPELRTSDYSGSLNSTVAAGLVAYPLEPFAVLLNSNATHTLSLNNAYSTWPVASSDTDITFRLDTGATDTISYITSTNSPAGTPLNALTMRFEDGAEAGAINFQSLAASQILTLTVSSTDPGASTFIGAISTRGLTHNQSSTARTIYLNNIVVAVMDCAGANASNGAAGEPGANDNGSVGAAGDNGFSTTTPAGTSGAGGTSGGSGFPGTNGGDADAGLGYCADIYITNCIISTLISHCSIGGNGGIGGIGGSANGGNGGNGGDGWYDDYMFTPSNAGNGGNGGNGGTGGDGGNGGAGGNSSSGGPERTINVLGTSEVTTLYRTSRAGIGAGGGLGGSAEGGLGGSGGAGYFGGSAGVYGDAGGSGTAGAAGADGGDGENLGASQLVNLNIDTFATVTDDLPLP